jgi:hypothetical protein
MRWDVTRAGRPALRQTVDLADPELVGWPGMLGGGRVLATALISGPGIIGKTIVASPAAVVARLDEHTLLATALETTVRRSAPHSSG